MHELNFTQTVPLPLEKCWAFFSTPQNLRHITPPYLGFSDINASNTSMYAGQIIMHKIRPFSWLPMDWITEITHVNEPFYFIDEQRLGPYKFWHHEHHFEKVDKGTLITDKIYYKLYGGIIGRAINKLKIKEDLEAIFLYRKQKIQEIFGS